MILDWTTFLLLLSAATPILLAALGEAIVERAGVLNLGVEGMMITGALAGFAAAHATGSPAAGLGTLRLLLTTTGWSRRRDCEMKASIQAPPRLESRV